MYTAVGYTFADIKYVLHRKKC